MEQTYKTSFILKDGTRIKRFQKGNDCSVEFTDRDSVEQCLGWMIASSLNKGLERIEHYRDKDDIDDKEAEQRSNK